MIQRLYNLVQVYSKCVCIKRQI